MASVETPGIGDKVLSPNLLGQPWASHFMLQSLFPHLKNGDNRTPAVALRLSISSFWHSN